jgi:hypothetical protein
MLEEFARHFIVGESQEREKLAVVFFQKRGKGSYAHSTFCMGAISCRQSGARGSPEATSGFEQNE